MSGQEFLRLGSSFMLIPYFVNIVGIVNQLPSRLRKYAEQVKESRQTSYCKCTSTKSEKVYLVSRLVVFKNELIAFLYILRNSHSES